jgi:hypothetical protein
MATSCRGVYRIRDIISISSCFERPPFFYPCGVIIVFSSSRWSGKMSNALLILALVFVGLFVIFSMRIVYELSKRGVKINYFLLRLFLIKYISQYKELTVKETGKSGSLYYPCVAAISLALVLAVAGLLLKFL